MVLQYDSRNFVGIFAQGSFVGIGAAFGNGDGLDKSVRNALKRLVAKSWWRGGFDTDIAESCVCKSPMSYFFNGTADDKFAGKAFARLKSLLFDGLHGIWDGERTSETRTAVEG